ncbi:MAG: hypothetical protein ACI4J0_09600 [Huintestinicola sp.]|uniref:hypothetical protein n=1 Tax=Huintestinicola sp. TaxID=2981661 RepID=UPI003F0F39BB
MRITAQFDSVDSAEFAALAVRGLGEGIFDVSLTERRKKVHRDGDFAPMGFFTNLNTGTFQPLTPVSGLVSADSESSESVSAAVDIICRPSDAKRVVSALMNKGGHDIKAR